MKVPKIWITLALAIFSIVYGLVILWYVPTQTVVPLGCLIGPVDHGTTGIPGLEIEDTSELDKVECIANTPEVGDRIIEVAGRPIHSFTDWVRIHRDFRNLDVGSAGMLEFGIDPTEDRNLGNLAVVEYPDRTRFVKVWFVRPGNKEALISFVPLVPQPTFGVSIALVWYVLQLFVVVIGCVACWNRPFDQPVRIFVALSAVTMLAFIGGSHWWIVAASPFLISVFAISGALLPAVLLHFLTVYPYPTPTYLRTRTISLVLLYTLPTLAAITLVSLIFTPWLLTQDYGQGPFAETLERLSSRLTIVFMPVLRNVIYSVLVMALGYFAICVQRLLRSYQSARNPLEQNQVRWILWAAVFATIPIGYTVYLALFDQVHFSLGASRLPMFIASMAFMFAYGVGVARYKLMLIDQVISRGVWYYGSSVALAIIFSALISVGVVNALHQDLAIFGQTVPITLVLMTSILVLSWFRDATQRVLDRNFFSEKYQLGKALRQMNNVATDVFEPEAVSSSLLDSCRDVLQVNEAALYLRRHDSPEFRMLMASGQGEFPLHITISPEATERLNENRILQRVPQGRSPSQELIRQLNAEVLHGLDIQGRLAGILVLGAKPNHTTYSAEDVAFVIAMARISAIALHCATVQQDVGKLNQDLQLKTELINDQERQIHAFQQELAALSKPPEPVPEKPPLESKGIIGSGNAIQNVLETVRKVATSQSSVLIRGESGTGKELLARAIHDNSTRKEGPLVSVHCAALSPTLLESELFGHVKGAFTDAKEDKTGRFQQADGGTLFLDEIGDISLEVQIKLLRVLQERMIEPVGSVKSVPVDVRVVAATHRNLEELIASGQFREDLFYRLNVISLTLPPLRERKEDLHELTIHFLRIASEKAGKQVYRINQDAMQVLLNHRWPGNIRELQNVIERAVVLAESEAIHIDDLPGELLNPTQLIGQSASASTPSRLVSEKSQITVARKTVLDQQSEEDSLRAALEQCNGNKAEAARSLGIPRSTFFSKLKKYGIS